MQGKPKVKTGWSKKYRFILCEIGGTIIQGGSWQWKGWTKGVLQDNTLE